ncbi:MAG: hypothetical protein AAGB46_04940 [Verrucomicrobiota bacterium]
MIGKVLFRWKAPPPWKGYVFRNRGKRAIFMWDRLPKIAITLLATVSSLINQFLETIPEDGSSGGPITIKMIIIALWHGAIAIALFYVILHFGRKINVFSFTLAEDRIVYGDFTHTVLLAYTRIPSFRFESETLEGEDYDFLVLEMNEPQRLVLNAAKDQEKIATILKEKGLRQRR